MPKPTPRHNVTNFREIPNVGPATVGDFEALGLRSPSDLVGKNPYQLYEKLCRVTGHRHDPCAIDVFIAAVRYMEGGPKKPWWHFTKERKRVLAKQA